MRCLVCRKWSFRIICKTCQEEFLILKPKIRLVGDIKVYSFYSYEDIAFLLNTKYYAIGSRVFNILAKKASVYFSQNLSDSLSEVYGVGIDDNPKKGYSHTGILLKNFSSSIKPIYGELNARNKIQYAGKSLAFRQNNPKNFSFKVKNRNLVIFDDIITTGTSILEAKNVIEKNNNRVLFALVLSDASS